MRKWRAWSLPLSPLGRLLLKQFREAHLGGPLSRSSKDDAEVGGEGKSHYFPWVRPRFKFAESAKTSPKASVSSPSGREGRRSSKGQLQGGNWPW